MRKKEGQILILVLLVVVVALAVGLSVGARNVTNLKTSTQSEQSQRAFTAAEGGVEDVLSKINAVAKVIGGTAVSGSNCTQNTSDASKKQADCTLQNASTTTGVSGTVNVTANSAYTKTVDLGDVAQINLEGYTPSGGGKFTVEWGNSSEINPVPSLEFTFICVNDANTKCGATAKGTGLDVTLEPTKLSGAYGQVRFAFSRAGETYPIGSTQTGFTDCDTGSSGYTCKATFTVLAVGGVPSDAALKILRIKPLWGKVTIKVTPVGTALQVASFPVQTYVITSVATTDTGVTRKVEVRRDALPQMPAFFDYALYSGGNITK